MSIDIGRALSNGLNRSLKRNGAVLFVVFLVLGAVGAVATQSAFSTLLPQTVQLLQETSQRPLPPEFIQLMEAPQPLAVSMSLEGAVALVLGAFVLGQTARVVSDRTFISNESDRLHEPDRWIIPATLSSIGGVIIIAVLFSLLYFPVGFLVLAGPLLGVLWIVAATIVAIVLGISFFFFRQKIASEDIGPIDALTDSWSLVKGNRFEVFGLAAVLAIISFVGNTIISGLFGLFSPRAGVIAGIVMGAALLVFDSAVAAQVYRQLRAEKHGIESDDRTDDAAEDSGWEPDEKWDDPPL